MYATVIYYYAIIILTAPSVHPSITLEMIYIKMIYNMVKLLHHLVATPS